MNKAPLAVGPMARPATFYGYAWRKLSKWNYIAIGAAWINGIIWYIALEEFDASEIRVSKLQFFRESSFVISYVTVELRPRCPVQPYP